MLSIAKKTLKIAKETGNDVIVQVKKNQKTLLKDCQNIAKTKTADGVYTEPLCKAHNRIESRTAEMFISPTLTDAEDWNLVKVIVKIRRYRRVLDTKTKTWKNFDETSFYISTIILSAQTFCKAIREHWSIENKNHYVRDVAMKEDLSRIRINAHVFAKLRGFALNILRKNDVDNISYELYKNSMKLEHVLNYDGILQN